MRVVVAAALVLGLTGCSSTAPHEASKPMFGTWGIDTSEIDKTVKPGDNFFRYAVGNWMKSATIPADETNAGVNLDIQNRLNDDLKSIMEHSAASKAPSGPIEQQVGDLYASYLDQGKADTKGVQPIKDDLAAIDAVSDKAELGHIFAQLDKGNAKTPFLLYVDIDPRDPTRYVPVLWQSGLSFGGRDYYIDDSDEFADLRTQFVAHVERTLRLAGYPDADVQAKQILALETELAKVQWTPEQEQDVDKTSAIMPRAEVEKLAKGVPLKEILDAEGIPAEIEFRVGMPDVVTKTAAIFVDQPLEAWKAYARYQLIAKYGPYLSQPFDDELFAFYSRTLNGVDTQTPRWRRGVDLTSAGLGEAVGRLYVAKRFPPESRAEVASLVKNLRNAYSQRIAAAEWMSTETKKEAQTKLDAIVAKLGYPDTWKSYDSLQIRKDDLVGNVKSAELWSWNDQLQKLGKPIDRAEWSTTPQTNNAFYSPQLNDITFPAGILQPPYFDPAADPAVNYGETGATIGHEMSHAFDSQGRKSDSTGKLRDWWTPADATRYAGASDKLIEQFDAYEPLPGQHIDGGQTLDENIADLAGLRVAYDAYKLALGGVKAPVIDGLTGDQRFFIAYADSWREINRPEEMRDNLINDYHSPPEYRVNGIVRNMDEWYTAFGVSEGDKLYLKPEDRVRVW